MSTPRSFDSINELLAAAREHGLSTERTGGGHWRLRKGSKQQVILSATTNDMHALRNAVAQVRQSFQIDIRFPPVRKLAREPEEAVPVVRVPVWDTPTEVIVRRVVREELEAALGPLKALILKELVQKETVPSDENLWKSLELKELSPVPANGDPNTPSPPPATVEIGRPGATVRKGDGTYGHAEEAISPGTAPAPPRKARKRRTHLTDGQWEEALALYAEGRGTQQEIADWFGVSASAVAMRLAARRKEAQTQ